MISKLKIAYIAMIYFIAFVFPFLALINCSKWPFVLNLTENICLLNYEFIRSTEGFLKGFHYVNAFNLYIPIMCYIAFVVIFAHFSSKLFNKK
ncbi:MAG: hypothetical protein ACI8XX_000151 [Polaribacter sp.]|jgi:hypothetical protein